MVEEIKNHGKTLTKWHFPEFEKMERSAYWYIILIIIAVGLLIFSLTESNFLFAVIIVMVVIIILLYQRKESLELDIKITEAGLQIGEKFYAYKDLEKFFIIYEPPEISTLYIEFKSNLKPRLSIPLQDQNPVKVRNTLLLFLEEDIYREEEPTSDSLTRWLKL